MKKSPERRNGEPDLLLRGVSKVFHTGNGSETVLSEVGFEAADGEFVCILGPSGCGKSTLLKLVAGFEFPTAGEILVKGRPVAGPGQDRCVVFQEDALFPWLTVIENTAFGLRARGLPQGEAFRRGRELLAQMDLAGYEEHLPREISGGMKQRVALARVLILEPLVLLMDEPFAALDAQTRRRMQNLLLGMWSEFAHTILFVTHDVEEAVLLADRILVVSSKPGRISRELSVPLARPRQRDSTECAALVRELNGLLDAEGQA